MEDSMSAKKSWSNGWPMLTNDPMTGNVTSVDTDVTNLDSAIIFFDWTASAVSGTLAVEVMYNQTGLWEPLSGLSALVIGGTSGADQIMLKWLPFGKIRITYTRISGSGTLNATITAKGN